MYNILMKNIRCFSDEQIVPVKPITILVGENSSGKSTFLASTRLAWDLVKGSRQIDFNEEPFILGSFDQIATYRGGKAGRAKEFSIGVQIKVKRKGGDNVDATAKGCFSSADGKPKLSEWSLNTDGYEVKVIYGKEKQNLLITVPSGSSQYEMDQTPFPLSSIGIAEFFQYLRWLVMEKGFTKSVEGKKPKDEELSYLSVLGRNFDMALGTRPYPIAPIRTKPSITYDQLKDIPSPEGAHIPILLAKLYSSDKSAWEKLRKSLDSFGKASGLFDDVEVRRMGQKQGDPFQLQVKISGPPFNLVYVGYGVSQVLPIIVDSLQASKGSTFLLQQPEVHLHPKAQAELGSFLSSISKFNQIKFIVETHSDYLLDRIRMDIRDEKFLKADDVEILYFDRLGGTVAIRPISIDKNGNLENVPNGYRQFFLEEEHRMLLG